MKYKQKLPKEVEAKLDAYIERIKAIKWFQPASDLKKKTVDTAVKASLSAFGVKASIEYKALKTPADWDAAWGAARGAARDAARDAAWGAAWDAARDAARDAAWGAAWGAARDAARDAAWGAAWDAAWGAARDAARGAAWGAARDAAWDAAWGAARDAAWDAARDAAWGAGEILVSDLKEYKGKFAFLTLVDLYEMGLYPAGLINDKFVVYVPASKLEFPNELV